MISMNNVTSQMLVASLFWNKFLTMITFVLYVE